MSSTILRTLNPKPLNPKQGSIPPFPPKHKGVMGECRDAGFQVQGLGECLWKTCNNSKSAATTMGFNEKSRMTAGSAQVVVVVVGGVGVGVGVGVEAAAAGVVVLNEGMDHGITYLTRYSSFHFLLHSLRTLNPIVLFIAAVAAAGAAAVAVAVAVAGLPLSRPIHSRKRYGSRVRSLLNFANGGSRGVISG